MKPRFGLAIMVVLITLAVAPTTATAQTFDNSGGGSWKEYISFPITTTPTEYAQYKIVINGTTWELYNVTGSLEASGTNDNFWELVQVDGDDIRVFRENYEQLYFWVEYFNSTEQKAIIWVKIPANTQELNIAYGNPSATLSNYHKPKLVFEEFLDETSSRISAKALISGTRWYGRPHLIDRGDGVWVMIYRDASGHGSYSDSVFHIRFSTDEGQTWTADDTYIDGSPVNGFPIDGSSADVDVANAILIPCPNGDLLLHVQEETASTRLGTLQYRSTDGGKTWTFEFKINDDDTLVGGQDYTIVGNDIYIIAWHDPDKDMSPPYYTALYKSSDNGHTWVLVSNITTTSDNTDEAGIVYLGNNTLLVVIRDTESSATYQRISYDLGQTWSSLEDKTSQLGIFQRPRLYKFGEVVYLIGRQVSGSPPSGYTALYYSIDNGANWRGPFYPDPTLYDDVGYSSMLKRSDGNFYMLSYAGSTTDADIMEYIFSDDPPTDPQSEWRPTYITVEASGNYLRFYQDTGSVSNIGYALHRLILPQKYIMFAKLYGNSLGTTDQFYIGFNAPDKDNQYAAAVFPIKYEDTQSQWGYLEGSLEATPAGSWTEGVERIIRIDVDETNPSSGISYYVYDTNYNLLSSATGKGFAVGNPSGRTVDIYVGDSSTTAYTDTYVDWFMFLKNADPANFGTPLVKLFQKKFGTKTVYVNITYLDTSVTERYNPTAYYKLEDKPQINVTSMLSVSGVNATDGANISIELIDFVTLDKVVYNGTEVTANLTYQGTITNATTGYTYNVYSFTTYEDGTLEIYGHVGNKVYEATFKLDGETVDIFNVTAVVGEALEITLPHRGNVTLASIEYIGVTSVFINTKDLGTGAKSLTITIEDPENFTVGCKYGTVNIDWGKVYFNITDLQNKTLARTTYGFFNKNFSILSTDPTKLYAGDIEIDVYFHGVKLKSLEIYLNHTNNGLMLNVSVNATQFKDYRNVTRIIASPNFFEVVNLSTKYPFSVTKLVNVSGTVVIDYVSSPPTSVKVEGATSYTYEKPVLKITASGNVTITDLYKLSTPLKDRLGNPVNFYVLINGSRVDASKGVASKLLKPSWYEVEVPITVSGFELWKFNDSSNIALVEINTSDKTLPTAEYRVPTKIETKEVRIQKTKFPWLPFPFLSESKPAQEEAPIVRLEGTLRDFYNAPIANRTIKIEVASPNFTRIYNVTTDSSGNFKIDVDMARGVEYKVTYKFAGDDVYVGTSTTKTFTIEQLLPAPPEEMTITELLIFVGIAIGLVAVVAGAIYLAKRTKAKTLARMESEFKFFRRLK